MAKGNLELIKKMNQDLVLDTIRNEQPTSRASIARLLNLSRSTVSVIVDELIKMKFVVETGLASSTKDGGRRGVELEFNPKMGFGVGVEISENNLLICITDLDGEIVLKEKIETTNEIYAISNHIKRCIDNAGILMEKIIAIGFCIPGLTNSIEGIIIDAPELKWRNVNFVEQMSEFLDKPLYIINDVNCEALGERWLGVSQTIDDFIYISIGAGVGSAIVANGSLVQGNGFMAGEIGYFVLEEDILHKHVNILGDFGVFDKKTSGRALAQYADSVDILFQQYVEGLEQSVRVVNRFVMHLSIGIANMVSLLNPEMIIIGGEVAGFMKPVLADLQAKVAQITPIQTRIELSQVGKEVGVLGAIVYAFDSVRNANI